MTRWSPPLSISPPERSSCFAGRRGSNWEVSTRISGRSGSRTSISARGCVRWDFWCDISHSRGRFTGADTRWERFRWRSGQAVGWNNQIAGHSVGRIPLDIREKYWYGSLLKYAGKHFRPAASCMVCLAVVAGAAGRAVFAFPQGDLRVVRGYSSVIRLAFASLTGGGVPSDGTPGSAVPGPGRDR